ncbi:MAG: aminotransferase class I/II-fold pyridoxal phosphate-dependent enzyme [Bacteroidia bacterium]|nr:aminotransferase class I/II-fold pyridoxal phosphate-dependent enzyme [Bacteroidia bacterium]
MQFASEIKSKLPTAGTTIFSIMSALAAKHNALNLAQGFPNFPVSEKLISLVNAQMKAGANQYAPMQGVQLLRERIAEKMHNRYNISYHSETEITITAGGTQAIFTAIQAVIRDGDEVIIFDPAYDSYAPAVTLAGGVTIHYDLMAPDYKIDWQAVKKLITQRTRLIIINTPHNPSGTILTVDDLQQLEALISHSNILVLSDEVYEHIIFDGHMHQSVCAFPALAERSFVVYSFGKTYHATGWKLGYVLAPEALTTEFRRIHQFNVFSVNTPMQYALADYMQDAGNYELLPPFYQEKRDKFVSFLQGSRFKIMPCSGSYFQLLDYSNITDEKDTEYAKQLTIEKGIASIPVSVFYQRKIDNKVLRFCFAKDDETLQRAAEKLLSV